MIKRLILLLGLISTLCFGYKYPVEDIHKDVDTLFTLVSDTHEVNINGSILQLDLRRLLLMTAMVESNMARDRYRGRVAKTYLQIEETTAKWYLSQVPELRRYIESRLGRRLVWNKDKDAMFVSYLIYFSKMKAHPHWVDKFRKSKHFVDGDVEYYIYKIYHNSILGATTYTTFLRREKEYEKIKYNYVDRNS